MLVVYDLWYIKLVIDFDKELIVIYGDYWIY